MHLLHLRLLLKASVGLGFGLFDSHWLGPFGCFDCIAGQRLHVWCPMAVLICLSVVCIGMFEAMRLSTHVLSSPCTIVRTEMTDVGTCTLCDNLVPSTCQIHPITSARLFVTFKHRHLGENITGTVCWEGGVKGKGGTPSAACDPGVPVCVTRRAHGFQPAQLHGSDVPAEVEVGAEEMHPAEDIRLACPSRDLVDEAVLVTENDVIAQAPSFGLGLSSMPRAQDFDGFGFGVSSTAEDIVVDDALAVDEEPDIEDQFTALALATEHLQSIESELQAHRDLVAREAEARRRLEDALAAERRRAEADMAIRREEERRLEEELLAARRRAEEEARLAEEREQRRQAEKRRQLQAAASAGLPSSSSFLELISREEMEQKARASAAEAKRERELREKAKAFLAAEGYRHVRAAHKWSPVASYPLHRAVQCNDPEMVRLLLWMGADATKCNTFGQTPMGLAKWLNRRESHAEVVAVLQAQHAQYCKNRVSEDPCLPQLGFLDQFALDLKSQRARQPPGGPVPCTTADVLSHLQEQMLQADKATCYYSSRDERGEDVWLSIPSPGLVDHAWFQSHLEYPVLMALGSLVLLTLLLGCLAVEGAELYFSGIV
eukprot:s1926_g12.t1